MTRSALNRTLLAVAGAVLLGGGVLLLIGGLDLDRRLHLHLPAGWPLTDPHQSVLSATARTRWTGTSWWWPVVLGGLTVCVLLALWWLLAQLGRGAAGDLPVPDLTGTRVRGEALARAVATEAGQLPGVIRARVRMLGNARRPRARMVLTLGPGTAPGPVLAALGAGPLARARASSGLADLPVDARIQVEGGRVSRVR
jgi:hypothetical protein